MIRLPILLYLLDYIAVPCAEFSHICRIYGIILAEFLFVFVAIFDLCKLHTFAHLNFSIFL